MKKATTLLGICWLLCASCGGSEDATVTVSSRWPRAALNSGLPEILDGTWAVVLKWPISGAAPGAAIQFLFRVQRWVGGWTEQSIIDATELCDVRFPSVAGQSDSPRLTAPSAWTPAGVQVAGGTVYYDTRRPEAAVKTFEYSPPVIALGWGLPETLTDEGNVQRLPLLAWQIGLQDRRVDGDGDGLPGVMLALPGGARHSIAIQAHFRMTSILKGSGSEELHSSPNSWPPLGVTIISNHPLEIPYLGAPGSTRYGAQVYDVPAAGAPIGAMLRLAAGATCGDVVAAIE